MPRRVMILHVGESKTGTSALQRGLFNSEAALAERGVGLPFHGREESVDQLLRPLGWQPTHGFVRRVRSRPLERLVALFRATPGDRLLVTNEDLCELDEGRAERVVELADRADLDVRVVLSARTLVSVVPSEWQQFLKHRMASDYPTFLDDLREHRGRWAEHFWTRHDTVAIRDRWAGLVGAERVEVLVTPDRKAEPDGLYRRFGEIVGYDHTRLRWPTQDINPSWGYLEAEVYRRVNDVLGDRLADYGREYQPSVRWPFIKGVLPRGASAKLGVPAEHLDWVRRVAGEQRDALAAGASPVHGDVDALVPGPDSATPVPVLDEAAVAEAAISALANLTVHGHEQRVRDRAKAAGRSRKAGASATAGKPGPGRAGRLRAAARRRT